VSTREERGTLPGDPVSRAIRALDAFQRRRMGIWEFSDDPDCIFRIGLGRARRDLELPDGTRIVKGQQVGIIHIWGDHLPVIPSSGADLAWARQTVRRLERSLHLLAQHVSAHPALAHVPAIGNETVFPYTTGTVCMLQRIGFTVSPPVPPSSVFGHLYRFGARLWTWLLRRAYNPESASRESFADLEIRSMWMSRRTLLDHHLR